MPMQVMAREFVVPREPLRIGCPPGETKSDYCFIVCKQVLVQDAVDDIPTPMNGRNWWEPQSSPVYQAPRSPSSPPVYRMVCTPQTKR